jgi:hypothetical protein
MTPNLLHPSAVLDSSLQMLISDLSLPVYLPSTRSKLGVFWIVSKITTTTNSKRRRNSDRRGSSRPQPRSANQ